MLKFILFFSVWKIKVKSLYHTSNGRQKQWFLTWGESIISKRGASPWEKAGISLTILVILLTKTWSNNEKFNFNETNLYLIKRLRTYY